MTKYRTQTTEVLNDSDDFERKLSWILFKQEIAIDYSQPGWVPGDPLHEPPELTWANYSFPETHVEPVFNKTRCFSCNTSWLGPEPCWVCGEDRPDLVFDETFRGLRSNFTILDEWAEANAVWSHNHDHENPIGQVNDSGEITWFFEPEPEIILPDDLDLSGRTVIEPPVVDITQGHLGGYLRSHRWHVDNQRTPAGTLGNAFRLRGD